MWFTKAHKWCGTVDTAATQSRTEIMKESRPRFQAKNTHLGLAHKNLCPQLFMLFRLLRWVNVDISEAMEGDRALRWVAAWILKPLLKSELPVLKFM